MSVFDFHPQLEKSIERALELGLNKVDVSGTASSFLLANILAGQRTAHIVRAPHLVILPSSVAAENFLEDLAFWKADHAAREMPGFDVEYFSGLYPNARISAERVGFLWRLLNAGPGEIFFATIESLIQKTLPQEVLIQNSLTLKAGQDVPSDFGTFLSTLGFQSAPLVEDVGQFSIRGGVIDIFSPAHKVPMRLELFGDTIESLRFFNPSTQRSVESEQSIFELIPAKELLFTDSSRQAAIAELKNDSKETQNSSVQDITHSFIHSQYFPGHEFYLPYFYKKLENAFDYLPANTMVWLIDPIEIQRANDQLWENFKKDSDTPLDVPRPHYERLFVQSEALLNDLPQTRVALSKLELLESAADEALAPNQIRYPTRALSFPAQGQPDNTLKALREFADKKENIFICTHTESQAQRIRSLLERNELTGVTEIVSAGISESVRFVDEGYVFLRDTDFFGRKATRAQIYSADADSDRAQVLSFGDLKPGDYVVHSLHGVGQYEGLKVMSIQNVDSEFIQVRYKDDDRLYLPIYRVGQLQKYSSGGGGERLLDKLGGTSWQKATVKVKSHLRDVANDLLNLYAQRSQVTRPAFHAPDAEYEKFEAFFPYDETKDQLRAVNDIMKDLTSQRPMDRIVCGDVGFGKTEVAMRAAFKAIEDKKQVAVLAPTTVLTFQHLETFKKRFAHWPVNIRAINRFVSTGEVKKTLTETREGKVDILIGTHRLLSKDVEFNNLGLLIIDEEQKFGVLHKERIRKLKVAVDTLTLSATPIPRTLNMGLVGLKDLSLINTAPVDRLPTRTFVCQFDGEIVRKAVEAEIKRGGQVYFIHNRIHSIYELNDRLRELLPNVRSRVAHGQMEEHQLEEAMVAFFNHEIDMLVCTAIVESGMDVPRANTMFIDDAHTFGLSQLYQLRGRVGRSKERAYCYLLVPSHKVLDPIAQERLKVIQENTALGSGLRIAQHDLELRGAGSILGEGQSGHIHTVGYELYMELLDEALRAAKGEVIKEEIEPDINVRIPALIPSDYMPDIRLRLAYYKMLSQIKEASDLDRIEDDLRDQYGAPPEPVINLMGLMLIRRYCKDLGVRDLSSGTKTITLAFTPQTPLKTETVIRLATQENKKYSVTPDSRLIVRMNEISWARIMDELEYLKKLV